jgi:hypothetical protein
MYKKIKIKLDYNQIEITIDIISKLNILPGEIVLIQLSILPKTVKSCLAEPGISVSHK